MKKIALLAAVLGLAACLSGCGYDSNINSTVNVVHATPTPIPTPTPVATPTPEPTPTPEITYAQTSLGVNIQDMEPATYYAIDDVNLRTDCSTDDAYLLQGIGVGTSLTVTGISEDGQWYRVAVDETTDAYAKAEYLSSDASLVPVIDTTAADAEAVQ